MLLVAMLQRILERGNAYIDNNRGCMQRSSLAIAQLSSMVRISGNFMLSALVGYSRKTTAFYLVIINPSQSLETPRPVR
jgi:hypothetical protein